LWNTGVAEGLEVIRNGNGNGNAKDVVRQLSQGNLKRKRLVK
jgi:hypothetical protein